METAHAAGAEAARRRVKRAAGLLREAERALAQLVGEQDVVGVTRVYDDQSARAAQEYVRLGVGRYGAVDVVVIARPTGRSRTSPTAPNGAKEQSHERNGDAGAARGAGARGDVGGR